EETGATTTSNNQGTFQFNNVPLADGANTFHVRATDALGNSSTAAAIITRTASTSQANVVLFWNQAALGAIQADSSNPAVASRSLAIVQSSVYDAVNAVEGQSGHFVTLAV